MCLPRASIATKGPPPISATITRSRRSPGGGAMNLQFVADGLLVGAMIGLGAIGVTLTYSILRFANFAHGELVAWGAYATLVGAGLVGFLTGRDMPSLGPFSFGW